MDFGGSNWSAGVVNHLIGVHIADISRRGKGIVYLPVVRASQAAVGEVARGHSSTSEHTSRAITVAVVIVVVILVRIHNAIGLIVAGVLTDIRHFDVEERLVSMAIRMRYLAS